MALVELVVGILMFAGAVALLVYARPRNGMTSKLMTLPGMGVIAPFAVLVGVCIGATFIIHGAILILSS